MISAFLRRPERNGDFSNPSCGASQPVNLVKYGLANPATPFKLNTVDLGGSLLAQEFPLPNLVKPLANGNNWVLSPTSPIDWSGAQYPRRLQPQPCEYVDVPLDAGQLDQQCS